MTFIMADCSGGMVTSSIRARLVRSHRERDYYGHMLIHVNVFQILYVAGVLSYRLILKAQACLHIGVHSMPTNCCVPLCTKKRYQDENGDKVSFIKFPDEEIRRKMWIHTIRRNIREHFEIKDTTKVCFRHFRDFKTTNSRS